MRLTDVLILGCLGDLIHLAHSFDIISGNVSASYLRVGNINDNTGRSLSRKRRFIGFPLGSTFAVSVCMTVGVIGDPNYQYLSLGLNWGLAYELPNTTWILDRMHESKSIPGAPQSEIKRRDRRDLYQKVEHIIDNMGYNGRHCVLRALCESRQFFNSQKLGMIPELLKTIFSLPKARLFSREIQHNSDLMSYHGAYFDDGKECEKKYPCSFSLLELGMGKYSEPQGYYGD